MASTIKVNNIQNQCGANIVNKCSTTITLGASGDNITLAAGATQSGFGRTGTVNWDTTAKTANFTAVSGNGYFVNTTSGAITVTLPASPTAGDIVAIKDYANTADTNNITIERNGSNIDGGTINPLIANEGGSVTLIYADATKGWLVTDAAQKSDLNFPTFIVATGGTVTCCGDYKIHTFTGPGTFTVCSLSNDPANNVVDYLVVAGGGGGGRSCANSSNGGGGAGGFRASNDTCMSSPQTSPLANTTGITVTATGYPITVGGGGPDNPSATQPAPGTPGSNSVFSTITSAGGGGGAGVSGPGAGTAGSGGSGGGAVRNSPIGSGNTPPTSPPQGNNGGTGYASSPSFGGGGGGGAGAVGVNAGAPAGGPGGIGSYMVSAGFAGCNGTTGPVSGARYFAGGGGGGSCHSSSPGDRPSGGDGGGGAGGLQNVLAGDNGTANTGGGGGGTGYSSCRRGGTGGSGIVIIRYKYQ